MFSPAEKKADIKTVAQSSAIYEVITDDFFFSEDWKEGYKDIKSKILEI